MKFDEAALIEMVEELDRRFLPFHEKVRRRRASFFNDDEETPNLGSQWPMIKYQTDIPRREHAKLKTRLTENHFIVRAEASRDVASQRQKANNAEEVFNIGLGIVEQRQGFRLQDALSDGQIIDGLGWLHWRMASDVYPAVPDWDEVDEVPECEMCEGTGKESGEKCGMCHGTGVDGGKEYTEDDYFSEGKEKKKKYRETDESVQKRRSRDMAEAGFGWVIESPVASAVTYVRDNSVSDGFAVVCLRRTVPLLPYIDRVRAEKNKAEALSVNQVAKGIPIYGEVDGPAWESVGRAGYEKTAAVVEVWTRDEFYELCNYSGNGSYGSAGGLKLVKSFEHSYGMPSFAMCPGIEVNDPDPERRYRPVLEGIFRLKGQYDRLMALMFVICEQIALPYYYIRDIGTGEAMMEDGEQKIMTFQRNSAEAMKLGPGQELVAVKFELNPAFMSALEYIRAEMEAALPPSGAAQIGVSSQPWTVRLEQAQQSVQPKALAARQTEALSTMLVNMAHVHSIPVEQGGFGESMSVYRRMEGGKVDKSTIISISPKEIQTLGFAVDIKAESSAERITLVEHGMTMLNNPKVMLTPTEFIGDYEGKANPDEVYAKRIAAAAFGEQVIPLLTKQIVAEVFGKDFVMGPNGQIIGPGGMEISPEQVLQANGQQVMNPQQQGNMQPQQAQQPQAPGSMGANMPGLATLQGPPGALPMQGMG